MANWENPEAMDQVRDFLAQFPNHPAMPLRAVFDIVDKVAEVGPTIGRPLVDVVKLEPDYREFVPLFGKHLKEIRVMGTTIRILCIFDPNRRLVLLHAGDKAGQWERFYRTAIPAAARDYKEYLKEITG